MKLEDDSQKISELVSEELKARRVAKDVSLTKLAEMTGLNRQTITFMETGTNFPSIETFARIALALDLNPSSIWKAAEERIGRAS